MPLKKPRKKRAKRLKWKEDYLNSLAEGTDRRSYQVIGQGPGKRYKVRAQTKFGPVLIGDGFQYKDAAKRAAEKFDEKTEDETFKACWPNVKI